MSYLKGHFWSSALFIFLFSLSLAAQQPVPVSPERTWTKLKTDPYPGKQDDITFVNARLGWYVNGYGAIYHTNDGGDTWTRQYEHKGTFFRCIAFIDSLRGFAGTVGTNYFPNVTDTIPLYSTIDGGVTWMPVEYSGPYVKGLCAIDVVAERYINHGVLDVRYHLYAVGRVGAPANLMISDDNGMTWRSQAMDQFGKMLFDIKMFDTRNGIACSASDVDITKANALMLKTNDGGKTWQKVYQSDRPLETAWKVSFPSPLVGYATIQSYDPANVQQRLIKTTDGGTTWNEMNLCADAAAREFGIGFIDDLHGFVGTMNSGYETRDGGLSWSAIDLGRACNKIRLYRDDNGKVYGYAIGVDVMKY